MASASASASALTNIVYEVLNLLPDAIVFGSLLFGILTVSPVQILFFLSLLESLGFLYVIQTYVEYIYGSSQANIKCKSKFHNLTFQNLIPSLSASNPSYPMYIIAFASSYFASSIYSLKQELDVLNVIHNNKYNTTPLILFMLTIVYGIYLSLKCDSLSSVAVATVSGLLIGILISQQNIQLFGKGTVNFLGIPLLRNKTVDGSPIYLCT